MPTSSTSDSAPTVRASSVVEDRGTVRRDALRVGRWSVSGTVKVAGDVEAEEMDVRGLVTVGGKLSTGTLRARGTLEVARSLEGRGLVQLHGTLRTGSTAHATDLTVRGTVRTVGALTVDRGASVDGSLDAPEVAVGSLNLKGVARIPGPLRALEVTVASTGTSQFGTVLARTVRLHGKPPSLVDKVFFRERVVSVDRIEADSVDLEGVQVAFVRAPTIVLGRGCHVTEVEGRVVRQHPSSHVGPESRTPPPYGLRR